AAGAGVPAVTVAATAIHPATAAVTTEAVARAVARGGLYRRAVREDHVAGLRTLGTLLVPEGDLVAFVEGPEAVGLDGAEVYEHVVATVVVGDEAVPLLAAEPLDLAFCHDLPSPPGPPGS